MFSVQEGKQLVHESAETLYELLGPKGAKQDMGQFGLAGLKFFIMNRDDSPIAERGNVLWLCKEHYNLLEQFKSDGDAQSVYDQAEAFYYTLYDKPIPSRK